MSGRTAGTRFCRVARPTLSQERGPLNWRWSDALLAACLVGVAVLGVVAGNDNDLILTCVCAFVLGTNVADQRSVASRLAADLAVADIERSVAQERAAVAERQRVARELHDIVGHSLSVIAVRSEAAKRVGPSDPSVAIEAAEASGDIARSALADVRRVLSGLREDDTTAELAPPASLEDLPALLAATEQVGVTINVAEPLAGADQVGAAVIRVAIVDDLEMVRTGFRLILEHEADITIIGEATNGREAIDLCRDRLVDVVLMDIRMPDLDGISATRAIVEMVDGPAVLILTTFGLDEYVTEAIQAGAAGFMLKDASADDLVDAVRVVAAGDSVLSPAITRMVLNQARGAVLPPERDNVPGIADLTERELEVLQQLAAGRSNAEIADALYLSEATVKTHLSRVLAKLEVRDRVQAVIAAFEAGIGRPER